jgi:hypothetical protein
VTRAQQIVYTLLESDSLDSLEGGDSRPFHSYPHKVEPALPTDRMAHWNRFYGGTEEITRRWKRLEKRRETIASQNYQAARRRHGEVKPGEGI